MPLPIAPQNNQNDNKKKLRKRIDHLAVARDFLSRAAKLREYLQKKGIPKTHRDYKRIDIWKQHAEKHMAKHKDLGETFGFTQNMKHPYISIDEADEDIKKQQGPTKGFKEFTKSEDNPDAKSNNEKIGSVNDDGEEVKELSGKKEKIILNPQLRTIQTNLPGQAKK